MIVIGLCCMIFFMSTLFKSNVIGYKPLYYLLIITFIFTAGKILYEWYHYWAIRITPELPAEKKFTVDIFTTFCAGEPYEMIVETLEALQAITYPHETYLCDEADDAYLKEVCLKLGVHHITRTEKKNAKAGNINNALKQSSGELCVVLDPDHVPFPDFLDPIVNYFNNPEVGYVQIVQAYFNQDQGWIAKGAAQQTYQYYGPMMMTMNAYGTAQAIGANCTFRRTALLSIGGHAAGLAEDMHTSMQMHAKGWKSVYVPAVQARGLVPATLSAYYKQQLKWSRGVFELFVTSYVKLFWKFTWRQKLHYGLVPLFYLSGFIYLINFIIPVISLFADVYPLRMDFSAFALISLPFITSVILIRHYVQRWVMEDNERGFHIIGGLLLIGTWWVFIIGFIYTIIRKNVPYIPTPKDITEERNLGINLPNIAVLLVSLAAIGYGLYNDWNPFTFIMAGICGVNCLFMVFMLLASEQHKIRAYREQHQKLSTVSNAIDAVKTRFWLFRRKMYSGIRSVSLMLVMLSVCVAFYIRNVAGSGEGKQVAATHKDIFLLGIFDPPGADNGQTDLKAVAAYQNHDKVHFNLVSFYVPWGDQPQCFVSKPLMDSVYRNQAVPMITWEPWQNLFADATPGKDEHVFEKVLSGRYDQYIGTIADELRALDRPVFLRFAHEADNPFYPWSAKGGNTPANFKAAWQYVHQLFVSHHAYNVIWVWNPWKPQAAADYFPGKAYVDWIGITGLNYGQYGTDGKSYSFRQVYTPFHKLPLVRSGLPVMIAEMGSVKGQQQPEAWFKEGVASIKKDFHEVKGMVLFNSAFDRNVPNHSTPLINWRLNSLNVFTGLSKHETLLSGPPASAVKKTAAARQLPNTIHGVIYLKSQNWYGNEYAITKRTIRTDFTDMKQAGINTIKIYGPSVYDHITLSTARRLGLKVHYSFWVPAVYEVLTDSDNLNHLADKIVSKVKELKDNPSIVNWNIGNSTLQQMDALYYQPELFYRQQSYINWLRGLVHRIKQADPTRTITQDAEVSSTLRATVARMQDELPEIDAYGLVLTKDLKDTAQISRLTAPYYFGSVNPQLYFKLKAAKGSAFAANWQDQQTASGVSFNGMKDIWGRNKPQFYTMASHWTNDTSRHQLPDIKILRPAATTMPGDVLPYFALVYQFNTWHLAQYLPTGLKFEWYQVRTDSWGNPLEIKILAKGASFNYTIPASPQNYHLYLIGAKGNDVTTAYSILNIPLNETTSELKK
jgi:beta-mannanase